VAVSVAGRHEISARELGVAAACVPWLSGTCSPRLLVVFARYSQVLHRDLKPQNILVCLREKPCGEVLKIAGSATSSGNVLCTVLMSFCKLHTVDFGLARIFQQPVKALSDIEKVGGFAHWVSPVPSSFSELVEDFHS
jgi:serine/threonine protein kinase